MIFWWLWHVTWQLFEIKWYYVESTNTNLPPSRAPKSIYVIKEISLIYEYIELIMYALGHMLGQSHLSLMYSLQKCICIGLQVLSKWGRHLTQMEVNEISSFIQNESNHLFIKEIMFESDILLALACNLTVLWDKIVLFLLHKNESLSVAAHPRAFL